MFFFFFFFFKQKTAYEIGTGDWSSDVCSSDLTRDAETQAASIGRSTMLSFSLGKVASAAESALRDRKSVV